MCIRDRVSSNHSVSLSFYPFAKRFCTVVAKGCNNVGVKFQLNIYNRTRDISNQNKLTENRAPALTFLLMFIKKKNSLL